MKINNSSNFLFFQKHLVAKGAIGSGDNSENVKIYKFDCSEDKIDLLKAQQAEEWQENFYLRDAIYEFPRFFANYDYYTLEDKDKNILCFSGYFVLNLLIGVFALSLKVVKFAVTNGYNFVYVLYFLNLLISVIIVFHNSSLFAYA